MAGWQASYETLGDTLVVRTLSGSVWGDTARLVPEVSIGMFDGPEEYVFGQIHSLAMGQDGTIYVVDRQVPALRVYNWTVPTRSSFWTRKPTSGTGRSATCRFFLTALLAIRCGSRRRAMNLPGSRLAMRRRTEG